MTSHDFSTTSEAGAYGSPQPAEPSDSHHTGSDSNNREHAEVIALTVLRSRYLYNSQASPETLISALDACQDPWSEELCRAAVEWVLNYIPNRKSPVSPYPEPSDFWKGPRIGLFKYIYPISKHLPAPILKETLLKIDGLLQQALEKESRVRPTGFPSGMAHQIKMGNLTQLIAALGKFPVEEATQGAACLTYKQYKRKWVRAQIVRLISLLDSDTPPDDTLTDGLFPLELAVKTGLAGMVQAFLNKGQPAYVIQQAFELAADSQQVEIARLLVNAGANYNLNYHYDEGPGQRCPICFTNIQPSKRNYCNHWICRSQTNWKGNLFLEFSASSGIHTVSEAPLSELAFLLSPAIAEENLFNQLVEAASGRVKELIQAVRTQGVLYWTHRQELVTEPINYAQTSVIHYDYFSPDTNFINKINSEVYEALGWLENSEFYKELDRCRISTNIAKIRAVLAKGEYPSFRILNGESRILNGESVLQYAISLGDFDLLKDIVKVGPAKADLNYAFGKAMDAGLHDIAHFLVQAGADLNYNYSYDHGSGQRCPFCYDLITCNYLNPYNKLCQHWVCTTIHAPGKIGNFTSFLKPEFDFNWRIFWLEALVKSMEPELFQLVLEKLPTENRPLLESVRALGKDFWTTDSRLVKVAWKTKYGVVSEGLDFFHPDPSFAAEVKSAAESLTWGVTGLLDVFQPLTSDTGEAYLLRLAASNQWLLHNIDKSLSPWEQLAIQVVSKYVISGSAEDASKLLKKLLHPRKQKLGPKT